MYPVASNVDYLRVTAPRYGAGREELRLWAARDAALRDQGGKHAERPFSAWGFRGLSVGSVQWGIRSDDAMLQVSGAVAAAAARSLAADGVHVARLDLAATVWLGDPEKTMAQTLAQKAVEAREGNPLTSRRRVTLLTGYGHGDTLMIGSRTSEQYGRIYDKHKETHDDYYEGAWRWEIEFKNDAAAAAFAKVAQVQDPAAIILAAVVRWFEQRGCPPPLENPGTDGAFVLPSRTRPDDARRLEWLHRQVAPCVRQLVDRYGKQAILEALDLADS